MYIHSYNLFIFIFRSEDVDSIIGWLTASGVWIVNLMKCSLIETSLGFIS